MADAPNVIVVIPGEYVKPSQEHEGCMVLDMPAIYAQALARFLREGVDDCLGDVMWDLKNIHE